MEWSEMLPEVLVKIAQEHIVFYEDYLSFGSVCKSWHSAVATKVPNSINGLPSRFPSLLLAERTDDEEFRELLLLSNKSSRKIRLPEAYGKVCTSSCGWLAIVGDNDAAYLFNPLLGETINLPNLNAITELRGYYWDLGIRKLLSLAQSSWVVIIWGTIYTLGFCRTGDDSWTCVEPGWSWSMLDITYYNGQVYSIDSNFNLRACDFIGKHPPVIVNVSKLPKDAIDDQELWRAYILGLDDDVGTRRLLVLIREGMYDGIREMALLSENYKTKSFKVYEYNLETEKWSKLNDLGRKSLFVGDNSSFWIDCTSTCSC